LGGGGTSLVIHANADDYKTDPAGNSGARIACGVSEKYDRASPPFYFLSRNRIETDHFASRRAKLISVIALRLLLRQIVFPPLFEARDPRFADGIAKNLDSPDNIFLPEAENNFCPKEHPSFPSS
jgi:hypothetical protein